MYARSQFVQTAVRPVPVFQRQRIGNKTPETRGASLTGPREMESVTQCVK